MLVLEIIAISSAVSTVGTGFYKLVAAIRSNKYAADLARINSINQHQRGTFMDIVIPHKHVIAGHTHGESAAARSAGSSAAASFAYASNKIPFYLSMSASDQRAGREGERTMHWAKDFNAERRVAKPGKDSMLVMIDVDEHLDNLPALLHKHFLPTVLYTFQPSAASGVFGDYRYTFNKDNELVYTVAGGGFYKHQVWNYGPDTLVMRKKIFGLTYAKSFFTVEKRYVDANHQLISLTPLAKFGLLGSILSYNVSGEDLVRLAPVQGDFIRLEIARSKVSEREYEHLTSTARVGTYNAATVMVDEDNAIAALARTSDSKLSNFQIKSAIPSIKHIASLTLLEYHRTKQDKPAPRVVIPTDAVNNYVYNATPHIDETPSVKPFMPPILPDCYAPSVCVENEEAMVKGRITSLRKPADHLTEEHLRYALEFTTLLQNELGLLTPVEHDEIVAKLARPSQKRITEDASLMDGISDTIKSFMKKEAYQKPSDPRPIATINGKVKYEYSSYTYAVAEAFKHTSWYAFGRTPRLIAQRIVEILATSKHAVMTDLSRFDGRVNRSSRQFEEMVMMALFHSEHHKNMLLLMRKQYGSKGVTRLGVKYKNGFNRQSGSPETAILNTLLNVFMAFCCFRTAGCEPMEAYTKLGIYGGDDGMTPDVDASLYIKTCSLFGHVLEADVIKKGDKGITFLSRMYSPDVWEGSPNSCADISRALSKFHVTVALDIPAVDKLFEKSYALYLTDAETPIIGELVCRVIELSGKTPEQYLNRLRIWGSDVAPEEQYPNENHDHWMEQIILDQELGGFRRDAFYDWLCECKTLDAILQCPVFIDAPPLKLPAVPVKINGELYKPASSVENAGDAPSIKPTNILVPDAIATVTKAINSTSDPTNSSTYTMCEQDGMRANGSSVRFGSGVPSTLPVHQPSQRPNKGPIPNNTNRPRVPTGGGQRGMGRPVNRRERGHGRADESESSVPSQNKQGGIRACRYGQSCKKQETCKFFHSAHESFGEKTFEIASQINGNNGSATNTDDHAAGNWDRSQYSGLSNALGDMFHNFISSDKVKNVVEPAIHAAEPYVMDKAPDFDLNDWVHPVVEFLDPVLEYVSPRATQQPRLVGVELNPGPSKIKALQSKINQVKQHQIAQEKQMHKQHSQQAKQPRPHKTSSKTATTVGNMVGASVAYAAGIQVGKPKITRTGSDRSTIEHTELLGSVLGSATWATEKFSMQPALQSVFTWLATQTSGWEKYQFRSLEIIYLPRCGTSTSGSVYLMPDYDAADSVPTDEKSGASFYGSATDAPWKELVCRFDMRRSRELFLRNGPLALNLDIKTYDFANFIIGKCDGADGAQWGKLYAKYVIDLINPQAVTAMNVGGHIVSTVSSTDTNALFGAAPAIRNGSIIQGIAGNVITCDNLLIGAHYEVAARLIGTGIKGVDVNGDSGVVFNYSVISLDNQPTTNTTAVVIKNYTATSNTATFSVTLGNTAGFTSVNGGGAYISVCPIDID